MFQNIVKRVQRMVLTEEKRDIQEKEGNKLKTFKREADRGWSASRCQEVKMYVACGLFTNSTTSLSLRR